MSAGNGWRLSVRSSRLKRPFRLRSTDQRRAVDRRTLKHQGYLETLIISAGNNRWRRRYRTDTETRTRGPALTAVVDEASRLCLSRPVTGEHRDYNKGGKPNRREGMDHSFLGRYYKGWIRGTPIGEEEEGRDVEALRAVAESALYL